SLIHKLVYNNKRFNKVSVLVIDQEMPGMKGLDLCSRLFGSGIKIIMLTGEASNELAINAFNNKLIDKFISKKDPNFSDLLNQAISEMQDKYFEESTSIITDSLTKNTKHYPTTCLNDPVFIDFYCSLSRKNKLKEHYL